MPSHRAFKPTIQSTTAFNWDPLPLFPIPFTCLLSCSHSLLPPQLTPFIIENNQQKPGSCRTPKPLPSQSHQKLCMQARWQTTILMNLSYLKSRNVLRQQHLWLLQLSLLIIHRPDWLSLWLVIAIGCTWLLSPVVPPVSLFLKLLVSLSHYPLPLISLGLVVFEFEILLFTSNSPHPPPPQPHMCSTVQHSSSFPIRYPITPLTLLCSLHIDPAWLGRTAGGFHTLSCCSRIFLHQGLRHKPHTHRVVALEGKYLLSFCQFSDSGF